jgi:hypothetical protein
MFGGDYRRLQRLSDGQPCFDDYWRGHSAESVIKFAMEACVHFWGFRLLGDFLPTGACGFCDVRRRF